ncbi:MAG: PEGA domain-containing protein [Polyangiaceae bacterium]
MSLVLVAAVLGSSSARAQTSAPSAPAASGPAPTSADAADLRRKGNEAMAAFRPGEALDDYKQAFELTHDPALLYNMARALEALEEYPEALADYQDFVRLASPELRARVPKLDELMASVRTHVSRVSVTCNIAGARVLVREKTVGETLARGQPLELPLSSGKAVIEVDADGYMPFQRTIDIPGGGTTGVDVELVPRAVAGVLVVGSEPGGGQVFVDGRELGTAPVETRVGSGNHTVAVRLQGYPETSTSVVVTVGERRVVMIRLGQGSPIISKWWFWTGLGVAVAGGVIASYAALTERGPDNGSIAPGRGTPH